MKLRYYIALFMASFLVAGAVSCTQSESDDTREKVPPGPISNVRFTPDYGGGTLYYDIPADEDFLYVRAVYKIDNGSIISKSSSRFNNSLKIEGMGTIKPYEVALYAVDKNDNLSTPVWVRITPLEATVFPISESLKISPGFGVFYIDVENPYRTIIDICVELETGDGRKATKYYTTSTAIDRILIRDLEPIDYKVTSYVVDNRYGYESESHDHGTMRLVEDFLLDMEPLRYIRDRELYGEENWDTSNSDENLQTPKMDGFIMVNGTPVDPADAYRYDSLRSCPEYFNETGIYQFWDGQTQGYSYFETGDKSTGPGWPWSYYIDMGREVKLSRFRIWQVGGSQWRPGGCQTFEMYGSNDKDPSNGILDDWTLIGRFTFQKPQDEMAEEKEFKEGTEFWIDEEEPRFSRTFRYWRFKGVRDFDGDDIWQSGRLAEIDLYGKEVN